MIVAKFKDGVTQDEIRALIPAEQLQAKLLADQGLLGQIKVAMLKRTVFLEAFGEDDASVLSTIKTLPFFCYLEYRSVSNNSTSWCKFESCQRQLIAYFDIWRGAINACITLFKSCPIARWMLTLLIPNGLLGEYCNI